MEEVVGSIPTRSTKINNLQMPTLPSRVRKGAESPSAASSQQLLSAIPLLLGDGTRVNVERRPATRMTQQFLSHLDVDAQRPQIRRERMTEAVPADLSACNASPHKSGPNAFLQYAIRAEGSGASEPN
jgi:hypothetical protein